MCARKFPSNSRSATLVLLATLFGTLLTQAQSYKVLYSFTGPTGDASWPDALLLASDGTLYGGTCDGGQSYNGAAFAFSPQGKESVLYSFLGGYGSCVGSLLSWNGDLYGDTIDGGSYGAGAIFRLDKKGNETVLYSFPGYKEGNSSGLYVADAKGNFYGSTAFGGTFGYGTVFRVDSVGNQTVLYNFGWDGYGGHWPGALVANKDGNLYGVTGLGGYPNCNCGTLFKLSPSGVLVVLHVFKGGRDGAYPAGMVLDEQGNLFGTTGTGGMSANCLSGCGTVYELTTSGEYKILYSFAGAPDGLGPFALVRDSTGNLYGITSDGGDTNCYHYFNGGIGCGIVFELDTAGNETILHSFSAAPDGAYPQSLILGSAGELYGLTFTGGDANCTMFLQYTGCGTIFELTP
jgi:uncharacterized repeat protein (TIGR03803 family)